MPTEVSDSDCVESEIMPNIRKVIAYSGLNFYEVLKLPCDLFQLMLKNATLAELESTEKGREYLRTCERLASTEMDMAGINDFINKEV